MNLGRMKTMALLRQIPRSEIEEVYTHIGLYAGIVPIYVLIEEGVDYTEDGAEMYMIERNGIPSGSIYLVRFLWRLATVFFPCDPMVYATGEIGG
jgi:hypothetical protein